MKFGIVILGIIVIFAATAGEVFSSGTEQVSVPVRHPVYDYLERMETHGYINFHGSARPLIRGEITGILKSIDPVGLSRIEKRRLDRFLAEFDHSYFKKGAGNATNLGRLHSGFLQKYFIYSDGINLYRYRRGEFDVAVNPTAYYTILTDSTGEMINIRTTGLNFQAGFSENFGVSFDFRDNMESGRGPYDKDDRAKLYSDHAGYVTLDSSEVCYYDITRASASFGAGALKLRFGRDDIHWGPGKTGGLMLSDNPPPWDLFSARYELGNSLRFVFVTGKLYPYPEVYASIDTTSSGIIRSIRAGKYISAHRLEIYPFDWLELGISESVIYGERSLEPAYLNPFNLYFSAEHNLGDMDNVAWSGDFEIHPLKGLSIYGELFIDDMRSGRLGSDYIGNKFGFLGGFYTVDPLGIRNVDFYSEYVRLDPFVYTHFFQINSYKNWNSGLGHFLPPNSDMVVLNMKWSPLYELSGGVSAKFTRHGENNNDINAGGNIDTPPDNNQHTAKFLDGDIVYTDTYELYCRWEPWEYYILQGVVRWHKYTGGDQLEWQMTVGIIPH